MDITNALGSGYQNYGRFLDKRSQEEKDVTRFLSSKGSTLRKNISEAEKRKIVHKKAKTYEAFFLGRMLQPMFEQTTKGMMGGGPSAKVWKSMLAQEYAKKTVESGQTIGLAKEIEKQMLRRMGIAEEKLLKGGTQAPGVGHYLKNKDQKSTLMKMEA